MSATSSGSCWLCTFSSASCAVRCLPRCSPLQEAPLGWACSTPQHRTCCPFTQEEVTDVGLEPSAVLVRAHARDRGCAAGRAGEPACWGSGPRDRRGLRSRACCLGRLNRRALGPGPVCVVTPLCLESGCGCAQRPSVSAQDRQDLGPGPRRSLTCQVRVSELKVVPEVRAAGRDVQRPREGVFVSSRPSAG